MPAYMMVSMPYDISFLSLISEFRVWTTYCNVNGMHSKSETLNQENVFRVALGTKMQLVDEKCSSRLLFVLPCCDCVVLKFLISLSCDRFIILI